jgi:hypothetical protein
LSAVVDVHQDQNNKRGLSATKRKKSRNSKSVYGRPWPTRPVIFSKELHPTRTTTPQSKKKKTEEENQEKMEMMETRHPDLPETITGDDWRHTEKS